MRRTRERSSEWEAAHEEQLRLRREAVLKAASALLNERGYRGTSLADVAARLNITNNALYYYFKNKEELFYQCFVRSQAVLDRALAAGNAEGGNGIEKVERFVRNLQRAQKESGVLPNAGQRHALSADHRARIEEGGRAHQSLLRGFLEQGMADGSIRPLDPAVASALIMGGLYTVPGFLGRPVADPERVREQIIDFIRHSLLPR